AGSVAPGRPLQVDRLDRDPLDRVHLHRVHAAVQLPRRAMAHGVRLEPRQLHADHGRRGIPALRRLVRDLGQEVVQGPDPPGVRGGARSDRAGVRRGRRARAGPGRSVTKAQPLSRSPAGSKSGSGATSPATHSPKISTSTGCPGWALAAGTYAYAIERSTV